jgi:putative ABC transport system substrate-binding protein
MNNNVFCLALCAMLFALGSSAQAQQPPRIARVGHLNPGSFKELADVVREPFERGLRELGWTPGSNIFIEYRYAEGSSDGLPPLAQELVRIPVNVIVARGPQAIRAAHQATTTIPIVMSSASDPVSDGFVKSLARPGGNITGLATLSRELAAKRLELLKEAVPGLARVALLVNPATPRYRPLTTALKADARSLGFETQTFEVTKPEDIAETFRAMGRSGVGALSVQADVLVLEPNREQVVALAAKHRLPTIYPWLYYVDLGGLMAYATSVPGFHHRSANFVDKILKGAKPSRPARRATEAVRVRDQSQNRKADRRDDSAQRAGESGQGDSIGRKA